MIKRVKVTLIGSLSLLAAICAHPMAKASDVSTLEDWPSWVHQPPQDSISLLAVGIADTREGARQQAHAELLLSISAQSQVQQASALQYNEGVSTSIFVQRSKARSLPLQLEGVEVIQHARLEGQHAVMLRVAVSDIVASLRDALSLVSRQPPPEQPVERLLWALQHYSQSIQGLQIERALQRFGKGESDTRRDLLMVIESAHSIWSRSSVRVVAQSDSASYVETLTRQLPVGSDELLWLQLEQHQQTGRKADSFVDNRALQLTLRYNKSPFTIIRQQTLQATAEGASPQAAASDAERQLIQLLERPLYDWFL